MLSSKRNKPLVQLDDPVNDRDVSAVDFEHDDFTRLNFVFLVVGQEQKVAPVERRFHASTG